MGYNGYTNYETWLVNLWIDNDGWAEHWRERAAEAVADTADDVCPDGAAIRTLATEMQDAHNEAKDEMCTVPGVFGDLLSGALSSVNWDELARWYIDAAKEESHADG